MNLGPEWWKVTHDWMDWWREKFEMLLAFFGMCVWIAVYVHAVHHDHSPGCLVTAEDKLADTAAGIIGIFVGIFGTLIYTHTKEKPSSLVVKKK